MKRDGELDKDGLRKGTLGSEMFDIRQGSRRGVSSWFA